MSVFASKTRREDVVVPGHEPNTISFRKLTGGEMDLAEEVKQDRAKAYRARRGVEEMTQQLSQVRDLDALMAKLQANPLNRFDAQQLCKAGVFGWTFTDDQQQPVAVTPESIDDMDEDVVNFAATEILRLTRPSLFKTPEETADDRKNG